MVGRVTMRGDVRLSELFEGMRISDVVAIEQSGVETLADLAMGKHRRKPMLSDNAKESIDRWAKMIDLDYPDDVRRQGSNPRSWC